MFSCFPWKSAQ
ncbi:rCG35265 [Rattus norvegicus]|uniref:RCG35265 n=1 Tax=Rattus norvegicus TaxID=10116 RepID=A6HDK0_RAT|nr:rCG35265 [Rattus norvegicus]